MIVIQLILISERELTELSSGAKIGDFE